MPKKLKLLLEELAGSEEIEWIIPHPFLPPRYKKLCENRNMILLMDRDFTLHVRWEGARRGEWLSPTPGEVRRLVREVKLKITEYRKQLDIYSKFVTEWADAPFGDPADGDPSSRREPRKAEIIAPPTTRRYVPRNSIQRSVTIKAELGGESPMALAGEFFD